MAKRDVDDEQQEDDDNKYLGDCVRIEPLALSEEFVRLPADYAFWNEKYRVALEAHLTAKAERERIWAGQYIVESQRNNPATGKPVSVDYAKAMVEESPDYREAIMTGVKAEATMAYTRGVLEAIRSKREMLVSLGATVRQEMEHDPMVRSEAATRRAARGD